jgi:hypothetical protein
MARFEDTMRQVLSLEREVSSDFVATADLVKDCPPAQSVLRSIEPEILGMPASLEHTLLQFGSRPDAAPDRTAPILRDGDEVTTLAALSGRLDQMAMGCAALHAVAHREFKSTGDGNVADLAESQCPTYLAASVAISEVISELAVWLAERDGEECQCQCPSCGVGICLCARHAKETVAGIREKTAVRPAEQGIAVRRPRTGSVAAQSGLKPGDVILAAAGQSLSGPRDLQAAIRQPGTDIVLEIRRAGRGASEVVLPRSNKS